MTAEHRHTRVIGKTSNVDRDEVTLMAEPGTCEY
jgi:hypothetical protein